VPPDEADHVCWMPTINTSEKMLDKFAEAKFLFFDLETFKDDDNKHIPNYAVVQDDHGNQVTFPANVADIGYDITNDLCEYFFQEKLKGYYIIAHNFKGTFAKLT
jgi:hypothetical protein